FAYAVGGVLSPLLSPLGLGDEAARKVAVGLVGGFFAKEIFLETIALMQGSADAREALLGLGLSQAQAFSILVFVMLYVPCVATITTLYVETRSLRAALAQAVYTVGLAYVLSLALYATLELLA
ncbi:MAG: nucleoside recognition domain-containing protein, partial [Fervidicoccaceae archaeon]